MDETARATNPPAAEAPAGGDPVAGERRRFLTRFASTVFAGLVAPALGAESASAGTGPASELPEFPELPEPAAGEDDLLRMMRELKRALDKPVEERRWIMVIDLRKCVGCHACTIACVAENRLPPGVVYRPVIEEEIGEFPNVSMRFIPRPCMQCDNPPCTPVCPVSATYKRPDGIVVVDYDRCIGCRYCLTACPYNARTFDFGEFYAEGKGFLGHMPCEQVPTEEYGLRWDRPAGDSPVGNARKCHFCLHRIERGLLPQCVTSCIGRATYFGDGNDPDSLVSELATRPNVMRLKEELGTHPRVYYLL